MKKILSLFLASAFLLGACNASANNTPADPGQQQGGDEPGGSGEQGGGSQEGEEEGQGGGSEQGGEEGQGGESGGGSEQGSGSEGGEGQGGEEVDPDDQWVEPSEQEEKDPNELKKEGEKYETYMANTPKVLDKIPSITVSLNALESTGAIPRMEDTYLTTANKNNKGDYYGCKVSMANEDTAFLEDVDCQIKVRGNYTSNYRKKPFRLKFDKKQAMPGFSVKNKNWVLLADVKDHSNLRNLTTFHFGDVVFNTYGNYSSHYQPVELNFVDGTGQVRYWGTYLLCEQQEIKTGRVDITDVGDLIGADEQEGTYDGTDIGYLMEYDGYYTEERSGGATGFYFNDRDFRFTIDDGSATGGDPTFTIPYNNRARYNLMTGGQNTPNVPGFTLKGDLSSHDPSSQLNFISHYMENVYLILYRATYNNQFYEFNSDYSTIGINNTLNSEQAISKVIDVDSLVNTYILQEIACDSDIGWSSFYMDVDFGQEAENHLLRFEAPWDFDSAFGLKNGTVNSGEGYFAATSSNPWLAVIMNNEWFRDKVKERYNELYSYDVLSTMINQIDTISDLYIDAYARNVARWGANDETGEVRQDWARLQTQKEHATALKGWLTTRLNYFARTWLNGFDVVTHKKSGSGTYTSEGNVALLTNAQPHRFEAEDGEVVGGTIRQGNDPEASQNGYVGNFNTSNGSITYKITATKTKQAYFVVRLAKGSNNTTFNDAYSLTLNGEKLKVRNIEIPAFTNNNWHDWIELRLNSSWLNEGENTIVISSTINASNFDYLEIYSKDTLTLVK